MSRIKSKNTKPEMLVRRFLHANGFRFRLHVKNLAGKPDIALPKYRTVLFVQGCFWHGHEDCKYFVLPKTKTDWWLNKITYNVSNDKKNENRLKETGWNVITVWECDLKSLKRDFTLQQLKKDLEKIKKNVGRTYETQKSIRNSKRESKGI